MTLRSSASVTMSPDFGVEASPSVVVIQNLLAGLARSASPTTRGTVRRRPGCDSPHYLCLSCGGKKVQLHGTCGWMSSNLDLTMDIMELAFIGIGIMGKSMAGHLLSAGHRLTVHTRTAAKAEELVARGARLAASPVDAVRHAEVAFICVTDTPDVEAVVLGPGGIREGARQGLVVVDHSTISPSATRRFAAALAASGTAFLDAPVSGGDVGARNATLSIMVGGD